MASTEERIRELVDENLEVDGRPLGKPLDLNTNLIEAGVSSMDAVAFMQVADCGGGFVNAVAGAYEAGLPVSFAGLFAGEIRHRISIPDYPFQRRRHWFRTPEPASSGSGI